MFLFISLAPKKNARTHASVGGDLGERVVTAVALAAHHSCLAGALSRVRVTGAGVRPQREAVAGEAGVAAWLPIIVILPGEKRRMSGESGFTTGLGVNVTH